MGIFDKDKENEQSDYERIGVRTIEPFVQNGKWVFRHEGELLPLAPAGATNLALSPIVVGADRLLQIGAGLKGIKNAEDGVLLAFSTEYFPGADAKFELLEGQFDGHVYSVEQVNLPGIQQGQKAWICPYMTLYFSEPPKTLYLKIEEKPHGTDG